MPLLQHSSSRVMMPPCSVPRVCGQVVGGYTSWLVLLAYRPYIKAAVRAEPAVAQQHEGTWCVALSVSLRAHLNMNDLRQVKSTQASSEQPAGYVIPVMELVVVKCFLGWVRVCVSDGGGWG